MSFETTGIVGICEDELGFLDLLEASQREMRKRRRTKDAPTQTPRTIHKRRPKIAVGLDNWSFMSVSFSSLSSVFFFWGVSREIKNKEKVGVMIVESV